MNTNMKERESNTIKHNTSITLSQKIHIKNVIFVKVNRKKKKMCTNQIKNMIKNYYKSIPNIH